MSEPLKPALALFDFDGTLTTKDTMAGFLWCAAPRHRLILGLLLLWPAMLGYHLNWISAIQIRALLCWAAFSGHSSERLAQKAKRYSQGLDQVLNPEAWQRLLWHQGRGDQVVVVSAGLNLYLQPWCQRHGVALLASQLDVHATLQRMTGHYRGRQCACDEKARQIQQHFNLSHYGSVYAYGDSQEDLPMLALAHHPFYRRFKEA